MIRQYFWASLFVLLTPAVLAGSNVYRFNVDKQAFMIDASSGALLSPLGKNQALALAKHFYSDDGTVINAEFISANPPFELSARHLPVWRINFDNFSAPTLYISADSGKVVTKRHDFWRLFDWMFRFHVMDYDDGENVSNWLLFVFALLAVFATCSGLVLSYFKVIKPLINKRKNPDIGSNVTPRNRKLSNGDSL